MRTLCATSVVFLLSFAAVAVAADSGGGGAAGGKQGPIETFRLKQLANTHDAQSFAAKAKSDKNALDTLKTHQQEVNSQLDQRMQALKKRFGPQQSVSVKTPELLRANQSRVLRYRAELEKDLIPAMKSMLQKYVEQQANVADTLLEISQPIEDEPKPYRDLMKENIPATELEKAKDTYRKSIGSEIAALRDEAAAISAVVSDLDELNQIYGERQRKLDEIYAFVTTRMYWVRGKPLGIVLLKQIPDELSKIGAIYTRQPFRDGVVKAYRKGSWLFVLAAVGFAVLIGLGFFIGRKLGSYNKRWNYRGSPLLVTLQRLLASLLLSTLVPACLLLAALLLGILGLPETISTPGHDLLYGFAIFAFARRFLWNLFRPEGIAVAELKTPPEAAAQLLRASKWATAGFVVLMLPWWILRSEPLKLTVVPRVVYTVLLAYFGFILLSLLRRRGALMVAVTGKRGFWYRILFFLEPALALGFLGIVVMDVLGYRMGAWLLTKGVVETFLIGLVLVAFYNMLTSAVQQAAYHLRQRKGREVGAKEAVVQSKEVLDQLSRFIGVVVVVAAVVVLFRSWGLTSGIESLLGNFRIATVNAQAKTYLTLLDVFEALLWIAAGHFLLKNLPALYEVLLFPRMESLDQGTRFVIMAISRYVVIVIAYAAAILTLKFNFSSLGWALAAASVGLGFGLQEIVANFISGLILFFERPVRVGDVVTVGDAVGTVEKITIRATLVTNFDRQVMIIPNRRFIVDEVTNWSHNDLVVRGTIEVGVAYGTDVKRVLTILEELARNHPKVKKTPEPKALFLQFGDSSLNFKLFVYCDISERFPAMSEINAQIHERFAEEGIEIPFPQRDLHLRSVQDDRFLESISGAHRPMGDGAPDRLPEQTPEAAKTSDGEAT